MEAQPLMDQGAQGATCGSAADQHESDPSGGRAVAVVMDGVVSRELC